MRYFLQRADFAIVQQVIIRKLNYRVVSVVAESFNANMLKRIANIVKMVKQNSNLRAILFVDIF